MLGWKAKRILFWGCTSNRYVKVPKLRARESRLEREGSLEKLLLNWYQPLDRDLSSIWGRNIWRRNLLTQQSLHFKIQNKIKGYNTHTELCRHTIGVINCNNHKKQLLSHTVCCSNKWSATCKHLKVYGGEEGSGHDFFSCARAATCPVLRVCNERQQSSRCRWVELVSLRAHDTTDRSIQNT